MQEFDYFEPLLTGMSGWQAAVVLTAEVLPPLLVVLPAAQSGLAMAYAVYATDVFNQALGLGVDVPAVSETLALLTTAALAAIGQLLNVKVSQEEVTAIKEAMENADRYYRLTATGPGAPADWEGMSRSFKEVAKKYLVSETLGAPDGQQRHRGSRLRLADPRLIGASFGARTIEGAMVLCFLRQIVFASAVLTCASHALPALPCAQSAMEVASQLAAMFTAGEVIYLGLLWRATDDLWAPFMAALVVLAVDIAYIRRVIKREASF